jgi:hypothetical protein
MPQVQDDYFCGGCIDRVENQHGHRTTDNTRTSASSVTFPANGNSSSSLGQAFDPLDDRGCGRAVAFKKCRRKDRRSRQARSRSGEPSCTITTKYGGNRIVVGEPAFPHFLQAASYRLSFVVAEAIRPEMLVLDGRYRPDKLVLRLLARSIRSSRISRLCRVMAATTAGFRCLRIQRSHRQPPMLAVGEACFFQVEVALDPAPDLVGDRAVAQQLVDEFALRRDQLAG